MEKRYLQVMTTVREAKKRVATETTSTNVSFSHAHRRVDTCSRTFHGPTRLSARVFIHIHVKRYKCLDACPCIGQYTNEHTRGAARVLQSSLRHAPSVPAEVVSQPPVQTSALLIHHSLKTSLRKSNPNGEEEPERQTQVGKR